MLTRSSDVFVIIGEEDGSRRGEAGRIGDLVQRVLRFSLFVYEWRETHSLVSFRCMKTLDRKITCIYVKALLNVR